jgi:hypothetical protein
MLNLLPRCGWWAYESPSAVFLKRLRPVDPLERPIWGRADSPLCGPVSVFLVLCLRPFDLAEVGMEVA